MDGPTKELLRILAPNPSPLTGPGTNTFLLGRDRVAVIDPGPDDPGHLAAIVQAGRGRISHILVTHAHRDHSLGAPRLARMTGAPVLAFGDALSGRSPMMRRLADQGATGGGEGLDLSFAPDVALRDGDVIEATDWRLTALHTPGHSGGHLSFLWGDRIFCGDVVMGWSSTIISPPDGDLADYLRTLDRLAHHRPECLLPAHGDAIGNPAQRLAELAAHRRQRTAQILGALRDGPCDAAALARRIYDVPPHLLPAATRNVLAHLLALTDLGAVSPLDTLHVQARFALA
ncbi:MBL fold metallo-hydrolase [Paracoccus sediminis]|uniref:Hydroxyacylglutathione hydrolase n=1 Tax=Paracoccus sediminis TaxID=1214787 RepID=A0A238XMX4_9RHOB|nr:MBL fold metallo-hydrolase [Paracoccus sediminis]TBN48171.1 MBL fold metallo-hydrolase [Paracoccus sediminis]SNR60060.1 hydroxyacylglutathione hydrolase [Paracoccus sediminis]